MRYFLLLVAVVPAVVLAGTTHANAPMHKELPGTTQALRLGEADSDLRLPGGPAARQDTISFGYYEVRGDGLKYAVPGETWTFDRGAPDPFEGFTARDVTANDRAFFRQIDPARWIAEGNPLPWPEMNGAGFALCGNTKGYADTLGWAAGIGYGNDWCQRLVSPTLTYDGSGSVDLRFSYFNQTELDYDYTHIFVESGPARSELNAPGFNGRIGMDSLGAITPEDFAHQITNFEFGAGTQARDFSLVIEFESDGALSDEDGEASTPHYLNGWDAFYGACGVDDVEIGPLNLLPPVEHGYDFETDLQGWVPTRCPGVGSFFGIADIGSGYMIQDPCTCRLIGNVIELHNDSQQHPPGQHVYLCSPIVDRAADIPGYLAYNRILAEWDDYSDLPLENFVLYRTGWSYYPYSQSGVPGLVRWSPRVGIGTYYYAGGTPACRQNRNIGTDWGLPPDAPKVKFIYELLADCDAFVHPPPCSGVTNFTPLIDNIRVRNVGYVAAPVVLFQSGAQFQDGFGQDPIGVLNTADPGNSDIAYNVRMDEPTAPARLGDSLVVKGPAPGPSTRWESKLWFRLKRLGPGQEGAGSPPLFAIWRTKMMLKGIDFFSGPSPDFTWGYMDSVEIGELPGGAMKYQFCSQFRDGPSPGGGNLPADVCYNWGGGGEQSEGNEILPDLVFTPGTRIEYFITTNYTCTPAATYLYPDTTGNSCYEYEILPSYRMDGGTAKFPCVLYVDASNRGTQFWIEKALNAALNGLGPGAPIPDPTRWDRYDYLDASSNWNGPLYRDTGGNSGATIPQLLGYRLILVSTGTQAPGCMERRDWQGLQQWLNAVICGAGTWTRGLILDGSGVGEILDMDAPAFLHGTLAAAHLCRNYNELNCPPGELDNDEQDCARIDPVPGSPFPAGIPTDVFGNWCPTMAAYGVLGALTGSGGLGNKNWVKIGSGAATLYAQVIHDRLEASTKYRTVIEDWSYDLLTARDMGNLGLGECRRPSMSADSLARMSAACGELANSIRWTMNVADPTLVGFCINPCSNTTGIPDGPAARPAVTRLFQNRPNPFNPRTVVKFSLAVDGPARLVIYDARGRCVRTLVDAPLRAGLHEVVWDGTDDAGRAVASGVYWSRLQADRHASNGKMVILK